MDGGFIFGKDIKENGILDSIKTSQDFVITSFDEGNYLIPSFKFILNNDSSQFIESNPAVEENRNQLAVQRGPVVYCLESPDMQGAKMNDLSISPTAKLTTRFDSGLLDGVAVIETEIIVRPQGDWKDQLTRPLQTAEETTIPTRLIPVFSWGNRGPSEMSVWLPASR